MHIVLLPLITLGTLVGPQESRENHEAALWLARSCIGEAGWQSAESGECAAIMWVYAKGARNKGRSVLRQARLYSSAIKRGSHSRAWVFGLNRTCTKPLGWPHHLRWDRYADRWRYTLALADLFLRDRILDPLPTAEHYGGRMDRDLDPRVWRRLKTPGFVNWYYTRRRSLAHTP
jgi:hypothetical protein